MWSVCRYLLLFAQFKPLSPSCIVKFSQLEPTFFIENKFERSLLLIFSSLLCLIKSHFLMTKCLILYVLCQEKLGVDNWLGPKGLITTKTAWLKKGTLFDTSQFIALFALFNHITLRCIGRMRCTPWRSLVFINRTDANQETKEFYTSFYYIDMSVLPKNRQLVFSIRNYIRDTSEIFSISSLVKISLTLFLCFSSIFFSKHSHLCNKKKFTRLFKQMKFIFSWKKIFSTRR